MRSCAAWVTGSFCSFEMRLRANANAAATTYDDRQVFLEDPASNKGRSAKVELVGPPWGQLEDEAGAFEVQARRIGRRSAAVRMDESAPIARFWRDVVQRRRWFDPEKETLAAFSLDSRLCLKAWHLVAIGSMTSAGAGIREVFRPAIVAAAGSLVIVHNHPSGDPTPSRDDVAFTRDVVLAGGLLGISVLDHVIVGSPDWVSMRGLSEGMSSSPWHPRATSRAAGVIPFRDIP